MSLRSSQPPRPGGLEAIHRYFAQPHLLHLGLELAVCWVLERLLEADSYPTALLQDLARNHPRLRLSETVLHQALAFLEEAGAISSYPQRCPSRGRPRRMLHLLEDQRLGAEALMPPWRHWLQENAADLLDGSHAPCPGFHLAAHPAAGHRPGVLPAGCQ